MSLIQSFIRIWPYIWRHRRQLFMSFMFAGFAALLWGANLSIVYPVVSLMLDQRDIPTMIQDVIHETQEVISKEQYRIDRCHNFMDEFDSKQEKGAAKSPEYVSNLHDLSRHQAKLAAASRKLAFTRWCNSTIVPYVPRDKFVCFAYILFFLACATIFKGACIYMQEFLIGTLVELTTMDIRKACYRKALKSDYQSHTLRGTPALMSLFTFEMGMLANGLNLLGGKIVLEPLKAVTCIFFAFMVNWQLTMMSLLFVPVAGYMFYRFGKLLKRASHKMIDTMSRIYKMLEETFTAMKVVMVFGNLRHHRRQFHLENKEFYKKAINIIKIDALTGPATELFGLCAAYVAVLPCVFLMLRSETSIWGIKLAETPPDLPTLALLYGFLAGVIDPVRKLSSVYAKLKRSSASADRVFAYLDEKQMIEEATHPIVFQRHHQSIEFVDIHFSYQLRELEKRSEVLHDVNLKIEFGDHVLIVGENGSGKSTLLNLLPRFYDPTSGDVFIDGINIRELRLKDLRSQIAVVTQETLLFDKSIRENIRYGKLNASNQEITDAALQAGVLQFIDQLPDGFETVIGEKGSGLSGGQRQRIALARAFIRNPSILILDEATSAVDAHSEVVIQQALQKYCQGRTLLVISHHLSHTLLNVINKVIVMDQGRAIGIGSHHDLLKTCPVYQKIHSAKLEKKAA